MWRKKKHWAAHLYSWEQFIWVKKKKLFWKWQAFISDEKPELNICGLSPLKWFLRMRISFENISPPGKQKVTANFFLFSIIYLFIFFHFSFVRAFLCFASESLQIVKSLPPSSRVYKNTSFQAAAMNLYLVHLTPLAAGPFTSFPWSPHSFHSDWFAF